MTRFLGSRELLDRVRVDGRVVRAVAGFDATFSAPKSLSVWWALTGDNGLRTAHDAAVTEGCGAFGAVRGRRPGCGPMVAGCTPTGHGLTIVLFRQSTSRDDDPQRREGWDYRWIRGANRLGRYWICATALIYVARHANVGSHDRSRA